MEELDLFLIYQKKKSKYLSGIDKAVETGYEVLLNGGSSLDAVEVSVRILEDLPLFNAGKRFCIHFRRKAGNGCIHYEWS